MDWMIGVLLLIVGAIIGFFSAKFLTAKQAVNSAGSNEQTVKEIMAQQAASHLNQSRQMVNDIQAQCDALQSQLTMYEQLLASDASEDTQQRLSFFGQDADLYIRNKQPTPKRSPSSAETQPRDFSGQGSGLFSGSKNQQVAED